jgi:hypothetical protein
VPLRPARTRSGTMGSTAVSASVLASTAWWARVTPPVRQGRPQGRPRRTGFLGPAPCVPIPGDRRGRHRQPWGQPPNALGGPRAQGRRARGPVHVPHDGRERGGSRGPARSVCPHGVPRRQERARDAHHTPAHSTPGRRWRRKEGMDHAAGGRQGSAPLLPCAAEEVRASGSTVGEGCGARRDAGQAHPHLEHHPLSLLGAYHATPIRKLNDPDQYVSRLDNPTTLLLDSRVVECEDVLY